jgi:integrase
MIALREQEHWMGKHRESPIRRVNPSGKVVFVARYTAPDGRYRSAGTFRRRGPCGDTSGRGDCCAQHAIDAAYLRPAVRNTLGEYFGDWTDRYPRSPRTDETNRGRIGAVLDVIIDGRALRDWPLAELRRRHALELVDRMLRDQERATSGATNILRALSAMAEDAITDELMAGNPFKGARVRGNDPRAVKARRKPTVLSWEQMHEFAAVAARPRTPGGARRDRRTGRWGAAYEVMDAWRSAYAEPMIRMLGDCGLRIGELFALMRDEQDLQAGVFRVSGSAWDGHVLPSSTEKRHDRAGPIPPGTLAMLRSMPPRIDAPLMFPTPSGRLWRNPNFYRDVWWPGRRASGIVCTPQDFRHSYVSNLRGAGVDPADLADMAGHSVEVASAHYTHPLGRSFEQVRSLIG